MPRIARLDEPGSLHHVMNRGARHARVFDDEAACVAFLALLADLPARFGVTVHAYALMPTHFHLLLTAGRGGLGPALQYVQGQFSRWLNGARAWDGPVWKSRYRSRAIQDEAYLAHVLAYIHLNPVAGRLAKSADAALWTSHRYYASAAVQRPSWLDTATLLDVFGTREAYVDYVADVRMGREPGPEDFDAAALSTAPARTLKPAAHPAPAVPAAARSLDEAWALLEEVTHLSRDALMTHRAGRGAPQTWWLPLWWLPRATHLRPVELAGALGVHPSMLSRAAGKIEEAARRDPVLAGTVERLSELLVARGR